MTSNITFAWLNRCLFQLEPINTYILTYRIQDCSTKSVSAKTKALFRHSSLSSLNSNTQSYAKFLQLKWTSGDVRNVSYKIKGYFSQSTQGAKHTTLFYFSEN